MNRKMKEFIGDILNNTEGLGGQELDKCLKAINLERTRSSVVSIKGFLNKHSPSGTTCYDKLEIDLEITIPPSLK